MKRLAIVIGIEDFAAFRHLSAVGYAIHDAEAIAEILRSAGFDQVHLLRNTAATFERVHQVFDETVSQLRTGDEFWLYYAGHGKVDARGLTVFACSDSGFVDEITGGLRLGEVVGPFLKGDGARLVLLLDACNSSLTPDLPLMYNVSELSDVAKSPSILCYAACQNFESAYWSDNYRHGFWTHHLLQALRGSVPQALVQGRFVDPYYLHGYLRNVVPPDVKAILNQEQHPTLFGTFSSLGYLLDAASFYDPPIQKLYVDWRSCARIRDHRDEAAAFEYVRKTADDLVESFRNDLGAVEQWNVPREVDSERNIRWLVGEATIDVIVNWRYKGSGGFVAADIIIESTSAQLVQRLLDAERAPYFCFRATYAPGATIDLLRGPFPRRIGSGSIIEVDFTRDVANGDRLQVHAPNFGPGLKGLFSAHRELPFCVLNCLEKGCLTPNDHALIADKCFNRSRTDQ